MKAEKIVEWKGNISIELPNKNTKMPVIIETFP